MSEEFIVIQCVKCHTQESTQMDCYKAIVFCGKCKENTYWEVVEEETKKISPDLELEHGLVDEVEKENRGGFCHLHVHSEYSLLDGFGHPKEFVAEAKRLGQTALAVTDHGSVAGHYKWYDACQKEGIKPILGAELYVVDKISELTRDRYHITIWAKNLEGFVNLNTLVSYSYKEGFYYRPRVDWEILSKHSKGLIATSGCPASKTGKMVVKDMAKIEDVRKELKIQKEIFNGEYYAEMSPWNYPDGKRYAKVIYSAALAEKIPLVLTMDVHYPRKEQERVQDVMLCIQTRSKHHDTNRMKFSQFDFYIKSRDEMEESWRTCFPNLEWKESLVTNTQKIAKSIKFEFPKATPIEFPLLQDKSEHIREMCKESLKKKGLNKNKLYVDRMKRELDLIINKKFVDYFLVVKDMIDWAKEKGIYVGAARGSSCGSLVCYLLSITTIDPIPYNLMFERFIDVNRADLPDIDIDFEDERRDEVKKYLSLKYGADRVASLSTYGTFGGRMCLQDVGRVFEIPSAVIEEVKNLVVKRSGGDSRHDFTIEDTFEGFEKAGSWLRKYPQLGFAKNLEGYVRNKGVHAAGVIISNESIEKIASCYFDRQNQDRIIHMDYDDIKHTGLLKIDILGLTTLTVLKKCVEMVKKRKKIDIDFQSIDLEDKKVLDSFRKGKVFGVFQFDGQAVMTVCHQVQPSSFKELYAINALSRPGALHSGGATLYIERKFGKKKIEYPHPLMKDITEETYGIAIYQEQVMQVVRQIGRFDWSGVGAVRKMMTKTQGVEAFNKYRDEFIRGAKANDLSEQQSLPIWNSICTFGSWAFNKCVSGDTELVNVSPNQFTESVLTIKKLFENEGYASDRWREQPNCYKKMMTLGMDFDGRVRPSRIKNVFYKGRISVVQIITENGKKIKATLNHRFLTRSGFRTVDKFSIGDLIAVNFGYENIPYKKTTLGKGWRKGRIGGGGDFKDFRTSEINDFREDHLGDCCEHCGHNHKRMEVHHITHNAPESIMEWLCPSCHKKAEYKKGRRKVWQKGFLIGFEKIISLTLLPEEDVYDIEMEDSSKPTFIANEFVSHNSHSVAYTTIGYWCMWLKVYHPLEFYCAMLQCEKDENKKRKIIKEFVNDGGQLLPVHVNKSKQSWHIEGKGLRTGFLDVKGLGEGTADKIVEKQPYHSVEEFRKKTKKDSVADTLLKIGACDGLTLGHRSLNMDLFQEQEDKGAEFPPKPDFKDIIEFCPVMVQDKVHKDWKKWVTENIQDEFESKKGKDKYKLATMLDLEKLTKRENILVICRTSKDRMDVKNRIDESEHKGGKIDIAQGKRKDDYNFLDFFAEDETGFVLCRMSHEIYPDYKTELWDIKPGDVVAVAGWCSPDITMLFAKCFINLTNLKKKLDAGEELTDKERTYIKKGIL